MDSAKWQEELLARAESLKISIANQDEFDAVFGKQIAETMDSYKLMLNELFNVKRGLFRAMRVFWGLSVALALSIGVISMLAYNAKQAAEQNGVNIKENRKVICGLRPSLPECADVIANKPPSP